MKDELFSVEDQVIVVSGGSRGIGRALAEGFSQRGAQVVITGRQREALERTADEISHGRKVRPVVCDVADSSEIEALVSSVMEQFERIDTLINVAGVNRRKPALEVTEDDYDFILDINLKGAFLLSQAAGRKRSPDCFLVSRSQAISQRSSAKKEA